MEDYILYLLRSGRNPDEIRKATCLSEYSFGMECRIIAGKRGLSVHPWGDRNPINVLYERFTALVPVDKAA